MNNLNGGIYNELCYLKLPLQSVNSVQRHRLLLDSEQQSQAVSNCDQSISQTLYDKQQTKEPSLLSNNDWRVDSTYPSPIAKLDLSRSGVEIL